MSKFFIEHPILANVIAIITILLGAVCLLRLPVAEYPEIVPPTIRVSTNYPGASADVVASTVGIPIEQGVNGFRFPLDSFGEMCVAKALRSEQDLPAAQTLASAARSTAR